MPDETFKGNIAEAIEAGKVIGSMQEAFYAGDDLGDIPIVAEAKHVEVKVLHDLIATRDSRAERPRAILGCARLTTLASFVEHVNRFKDAKSTLWADIDAVNVRAFYDYHEGPMLPRWGRHHSIYSSPRSAEWQEWMGNDETSMTQDAFGVWIDDHMRDLASVPGYPEPAAVLEMARNLVIHSKGIFERKINPTTGEGVLIVKDEHEDHQVLHAPASGVRGRRDVRGRGAHPVQPQQRAAGVRLRPVPARPHPPRRFR